MSRLFLFTLLLLLLAVPMLPVNASVWYTEVKTGQRTEVKPDAEKIYSGSVILPESVLFYHEPDRNTCKPAEKDIFTRYLSLDICLETADNSTAELPVKLFVKDKDGIFFQSVETFSILPGKWQTLTVDLTAQARALEGVGHEWEWCDLAASRIFNVGFKIFSDDAFKGAVRWKNLRFHTPRPETELQVLDWNMPSEVLQNKQLTGTFRLSREYFNNFDPEEIAVDFEVKEAQSQADGKIFPAFYNLQYRRHMTYTREKFLPYGKTFWEFRYLPRKPGKYSLRLRVKDRKNSIVTRWRDFTVLPSDLPGTVGISSLNPRYLGFADGRQFWPIGLNIHTNIDLRCEQVFNLGHRPDRGLADYEDYFHAAAAHSINSIEIWMANWSFAIEGDVQLNGMHGMGSYNLAQAAKLDLLLDLARKNNIYIHLALDNHGKVSSRVDPEWHVNPMNSKIPTAKANGAFLESAGLFWTDATARRFYDRRNRYLAARYGADPAIWGVELWSEGDLTDDFGARYKDKKVLQWYDESARKWQTMSSAGHLVSTHLCGDFGNVRNHIEIYKLPPINYIVGDAYRNTKTRLDNLLIKGDAEIQKTGVAKPYIITEFGGSSGGGPPQNMLADIHCGLWIAFFTGYAGSPLLWWHDFVHINNYYVHYLGLAKFIKDIRRDDPKLKMHPALTVEPKNVRTMVLVGPREIYAWIYDEQAMFCYPLESAQSAWKKGQIKVQLKDLKDLEKGVYNVSYYNTITNEQIAAQQVEYAGGDLALDIPDFVIDTAMKMRYAGPLPEKGKNK